MTGNTKKSTEDINENLELFKRALSEAMDFKIHQMEVEAKNIEMPPISRRHKIRMNRLFREYVGGSFLPFSEEKIYSNN